MKRARRAIAVATLLALTGCSAQAITPASPSSSRMTRPSVVPTVGLPGGTGPTDPDVPAEGSTDAPEFVPTQIWVRSATYTRGSYALTLATAPEGDFVLQDTRAAGGGQLIPGGDADPQCSKTSEKPLSAPIKGALKNVTHLVTLTCHVTGALKRPAISGLWGDATHTGATSAIFALGDAKAQGSPQTDPDAPIQADQPVDTQVVSAHYQGENVTVTAWATEYAALTLAVAEAQDTNEFPECTTALSPEHRPGVKTPTQQRLFTITCSNVKRPTTWGLDVAQATGELGQEAVFTSTTVQLPWKAAPSGARSASASVSSTSATASTSAK